MLSGVLPDPQTRSKTLFQLSKCSGKSRWGDPVRVRQGTASRNHRLSVTVTPESVALPVSMFPNLAQMASVGTVLHLSDACSNVCAADPAVIGTGICAAPSDSQPECQRALRRKTNCEMAIYEPNSLPARTLAGPHLETSPDGQAFGVALLL